MSLQLRVEKDGKSILVVNANTVLHLNETASAYAYYFMQGIHENDVITKVRHIYKVNAETAKADYEKIVNTISTLAQTEKIDPITYLEIEKEEPFSYKYSAPLRMDLALTFRCQNNCIHCYAGGPHETPELSPERWKEVIDKLSDEGDSFTLYRRRPTLRDDLPELLRTLRKRHGTGLITNGRKLKDPAYVELLEKSGLDFVQVTLESHKPEVHDAMTSAVGSWVETVEGIRNAAKSEIYVSTNTTLSKQNADHFLATTISIKSLGVDAFGCNSPLLRQSQPVSQEFAYPQNTQNAPARNQRESTGSRLKISLVHATQYCQLNPVQLGLGIKSCTAQW
jgi:sulfatase maturation enzyme AslB (radical SAM superfamily)